ncbi:hypothetical protein BaRGS_00011140 [Batillaria attramentaria]|uniref:Uncharacterized protein n=1 Tax=Batillaria attramentaria TaxID=370345 RepID=A0ABD0LEC8_9CAEN
MRRGTGCTLLLTESGLDTAAQPRKTRSYDPFGSTPILQPQTSPSRNYLRVGGAGIRRSRHSVTSDCDTDESGMKTISPSYASNLLTGKR